MISMLPDAHDGLSLLNAIATQLRCHIHIVKPVQLAGKIASTLQPLAVEQISFVSAGTQAAL